MCHLSISRRHDGGEEKGTSFISFLILFPTSHSSVDESEKEGRDMRIQTKEKEIDREGTCPSFIHSFSSHSFISLEFTRIYIYFYLLLFIFILFLFLFYYNRICVFREVQALTWRWKHESVRDGENDGRRLPPTSLFLPHSFICPFFSISLPFLSLSVTREGLGEDKRIIKEKEEYKDK